MSFRNITNQLGASALAQLAVLTFPNRPLRVAKRMTQHCGVTGDRVLSQSGQQYDDYFLFPLAQHTTLLLVGFFFDVPEMSS